LSLSAPAGIYQTILDEGPEIGTLLLRFQGNAQRTGVSGDLLPYVGNLIAGWRERYQPNLTLSPASTVVESLSPRERNILERISQGRSNKEIARELSIAPETVKSHVKNIFIKLAVDRRAQAVSRAQSLGLVRINRLVISTRRRTLLTPSRPRLFSSLTSCRILHASSHRHFRAAPSPESSRPPGGIGSRAPRAHDPAVTPLAAGWIKP